MLNNVIKKLYLQLDNSTKSKLRKEILSYYNGVPASEISPEIQEALQFLSTNKLHVFPYNFTGKYSKTEAVVNTDKSTGLKYVMHDGKKLYFKRTWSERKIKRNYTFLLLEQDAESPHRYLTADFNITEGDVVVDAGAAEGNFALSIIDKVSKVYLFETDNEWVEALEATFAPWRGKVEIINKFVSNKDNDHHVSLDHFFSAKGSVNFIKADVEGAEADLLQGSKAILTSSLGLKVAITTYHKQQDQVELSEILQRYGFNTKFSNGYMLFPHVEPLKPPYFRRGLIRASK